MHHFAHNFAHNFALNLFENIMPPGNSPFNKYNPITRGRNTHHLIRIFILNHIRRTSTIELSSCGLGGFFDFVKFEMSSVDISEI